MEEQNRSLLEKKYHELKKINRELNKVKAEAGKIYREQSEQKTEFIGILEADME